MPGSSLMDFIAALKSDPALRARVMQAQQEAMTSIRREADAIAAIARDAGFDISEWAKRPTDGKSVPNESDARCLFTCCIQYTSTVASDDLPG